LMSVRLRAIKLCKVLVGVGDVLAKNTHTHLTSVRLQAFILCKVLGEVGDVLAKNTHTLDVCMLAGY